MQANEIGMKNNQMIKLMNIFFLACKKATELIEKREIQPLSATEKVKLTIHTTMCKACKSYEKQSVTIDKAMSDWLEKEKREETKVLSNQARSIIISKIKEK
jgi:hypothetical protein